MMLAEIIEEFFGTTLEGRHGGMCDGNLASTKGFTWISYRFYIL